jgi:hypothetical protein
MIQGAGDVAVMSVTVGEKARCAVPEPGPVGYSPLLGKLRIRVVARLPTRFTPGRFSNERLRWYRGSVRSRQPYTLGSYTFSPRRGSGGKGKSRATVRGCQRGRGWKERSPHRFPKGEPTSPITANRSPPGLRASGGEPVAENASSHTAEPLPPAAQGNALDRWSQRALG